MTANQLIQILTSATFLLVFIAVLVRAIRHPSRESIDIALFFSAPAFSIAQAPIAQALGVQSPTLSLVSGALILAMPLLTLRAVRGFTDLPPLVVPAAQSPGGRRRPSRGRGEG